MKKIFCRGIFLLFIFLPTLQAELPFSISDETKLGKSLEQDIFFLENELILEKEFPRPDLIISAENLYAKENLKEDSYYDEITLCSTIGINDMFRTGLAPVFFLSPDENQFSLDLLFILSFEFESIELCLEDENEFIYNFDLVNWTFVNTLALEKKLFSLSSKTELLLYLENEYGQAMEKGSEAEDCLLFGPVLNTDHLALGLFYAPDLIPEAAHNLVLSLTLCF